MFREIILPIFRSTRLCVIPQTVTHSLVFLKMGKTIARNRLSWLELLISRYCCIWLVVYIIYINEARSSKYQVMKYICWLNIQKAFSEEQWNACPIWRTHCAWSLNTCWGHVAMAQNTTNMGKSSRHHFVSSIYMTMYKYSQTADATLE